MADSISEGTLTGFRKQVGEHIDANEELASIETDEIDVSVHAPQAGVVIELLATPQEIVTVGQEIARIDTETEASLQPSESPGQRSEMSEQTRSISDEDNIQSPISTSGKQTVEPNCRKESMGNQITSTSASASRSIEASKETLDTTLQRRQIKSVAAPTTGVAQTLPEIFPMRHERLVRKHPPLEDASISNPFDHVGDETSLLTYYIQEPLPRMRKTIAQRLKMSQSMNVSLTTMQEIDMSALIHWRKRNRDHVLETYGVRLGYMGAFVKAATMAAQRVPSINGAVDVENKHIVFRDYVDISIAVSTPKGLVTPVLRNCESLTVLEIERRVLGLANKARDGKLIMDDLQGGNFSISNPGIFGSMFGTPIINYGQSAVFNMNTIHDRVVAIDGSPVIRPIMYTTLSYDHRLIEEREAVKFLNIVKDYVEEPSKMLLV